MTTKFTYAIQPSYLIELTDHCFVPSPDIEAAKSIALSQAQDEATDQNIWKVPLFRIPQHCRQAGCVAW
tara:strand:- start:177 stop:383 length:207 start_codon:yes stop_codon:yes gene_type:complete